MSTRILLISSVVFLASGLGLLFGYCHGNAGFDVGFPVTGTNLNLCLTTKGYPAIAGFLLTLIGLLLQIAAFLAAIVGQIRVASAKAKERKAAKLEPAS